jgi:hypothetical protein|tara:strand:- start:1226 stop:1372 length:147 start_codon:yes stop_codon:yes gene_type:complete
MTKRKELHFLLVSVKRLFFLLHLQTIDARLPDAMAVKIVVDFIDHLLF